MSPVSIRKLAAMAAAGTGLSARRRVLDSRMPIDPDQAGASSDPSIPDTLEPTAFSLSRTGEPTSRRPPSVPSDPAGPASPRSRRKPEHPSAAMDRGGSALAMSPRMTALFGGLFGLATVTTIIALLIQGAPPRDDRAAAAAVESASAAEAKTAAPEGAPAARGPKKRVRNKIPGPPRVADMAKEPGVRIVEDTIGRRSFIVALGEKGVPKDQVYRVLKAFDGVRSFDKTGKNDRFIAAIDKQTNAIRGFEYIVSPLEVFQAKDTDGALKAGPLDMKIAEAEVVGSFYVGKNFIQSAAWGGFEPDIARAIDEAFAGKTSHDAFEEGGTVRVIATEVTALGDFVRYKNIVAVEYRGPDPQATPIRAYQYQGTGARGYFDERGRQPDGSGWASPIPGAPVTSHFNPKRMHPVLHKVMPHNGTDYGAATGTPIYAVFRGKITHVGPAGPCGNMVAIMHPNGIESGYCHLSKIMPGLKVGMTIGTRQPVGLAGATGRATGPHLHFWTKKNGEFFDSETLKVDGFRVIPADERPAFGARKAELDTRLEAIEKPEPPPATPATPDKAAGKADDTQPDLGATGDDGGADDASAPGDKTEKASEKPAKGASKKPKPTAPVHVDPGDGDELVGADLKR